MLLLLFVIINCKPTDSIIGVYINDNEKYETLIIKSDSSYYRKIKMGMIEFKETGALIKLNKNSYLISDSIILNKPKKFEVIEKDSINLKNEIIFEFKDFDGYPIQYIELNLIKQKDTLKVNANSHKIIMKDYDLQNSEIYIYMLGYWPIKHRLKNKKSNYLEFIMYESTFNHFYDNTFIKYFENDTILQMKNDLKIRNSNYSKIKN